MSPSSRSTRCCNTDRSLSAPQTIAPAIHAAAMVSANLDMRGSFAYRRAWLLKNAQITSLALRFRDDTPFSACERASLTVSGGHRWPPPVISYKGVRSFTGEAMGEYRAVGKASGEDARPIDRMHPGDVGYHRCRNETSAEKQGVDDVGFATATATSAWCLHERRRHHRRKHGDEEPKSDSHFSENTTRFVLRPRFCKSRAHGAHIEARCGSSQALARQAVGGRRPRAAQFAHLIHIFDPNLRVGA